MIWPLQNTDEIWRMTVNYQKFNQVVTPFVAAVLDVVSLWINPSLGMWYATIDTTNALFLVFVHKVHRKQFAFSWQGQQYTFTGLPQTYIKSLALCHNLIQRDLNYPTLQQNIPRFCYIDDVMLIRSSEQKLPNTLELLETHNHIRIWEVNPTKIQISLNSVKFSGVGHEKIFLLRWSVCYCTWTSHN